MLYLRECMSVCVSVTTGMRELFLCELKLFAAGLAERIAQLGNWNIALELQLLPKFLCFAELTL